MKRFFLGAFLLVISFCNTYGQMDSIYATYINGLKKITPFYGVKGGGGISYFEVEGYDRVVNINERNIPSYTGGLFGGIRLGDFLQCRSKECMRCVAQKSRYSTMARK